MSEVAGHVNVVVTDLTRVVLMVNVSAETSVQTNRLAALHFFLHNSIENYVPYKITLA